ncbi:hypothetical protein QUF74_12135 [Candidatus Halobeggiatoa sp. HSG11]|nr:hypothetical protein [Candidatus Halobeggiatoa sp. HSG11]
MTIQSELFKYGGLPATSNFFGRKQELKQIEQAFINNRRFMITGIDGQGKTNLAIEIGRRNKRKVCFIDYSASQNINSVDLVIKTLADVLDNNAVAKGVAEAAEALKETSILLILDSLENVPPEQLPELLNVATQLSEIGECRLLVTSYLQSDEIDCKVLSLNGLIEKDALEYFHDLWRSASEQKVPKSSELLKLFKLVNFNPLFIKLLAFTLRTMSLTTLKENLEQLLVQKTDRLADKLWIILDFALKNLEIETRKTGLSYWLAKLLNGNINQKLTINSTTLMLLPRLGVFQHGAFEPDILEITDFTRKQWDILNSMLRDSGLIQFEKLPLFRVPYVKFHPILAATLWSHIAKQHDKVFSDYQQRYAQVSAYMSYEEGKNADQVRNLIRRDFPNLIFAVSTALDEKKTWGPQFVKNLSLYLTVFGFKQDQERLTKKADAMEANK